MKYLSQIKASILNRIPPTLYGLILMIYWFLHPRRPKIFLFPKKENYLLFYKGTSCIVTNPKFLTNPWPPYDVDTRFFPIDRSDIVIDVGAGTGEFTVPASKAAEKGMVIAIEPHPQRFAILRKNVSTFRNVYCINKAAWSKKKKIRLFLGGSPSPFRKSSQAIEVQADTLDNMIKELGIKKVDFLKMDIEGAEVEALKGLKKTLQRCRKVVIETHRVNEKLTLPEVKDFLEKYNFEIMARDCIVYAQRL